MMIFKNTNVSETLKQVLKALIEQEYSEEMGVYFYDTFSGFKPIDSQLVEEFNLIHYEMERMVGCGEFTEDACSVMEAYMEAIEEVIVIEYDV